MLMELEQLSSFECNDVHKTPSRTQQFDHKSVDYAVMSKTESFPNQKSWVNGVVRALSTTNKGSFS